ncbi:MAG: pentapeptide repeat-containing protein [Gammaproteobacteria bacterium]|nr:pentapeptide repeat-containing protein [Gammaproteobacteria bacterium]
MAQTAPEFKDNEMYRLLRDENIKQFNQRKEAGEACDLSGADFRNLVLSGINADGLNLSGCYFRGCDLRGIDFSNSQLQGASIHDAQISGVLFPDALSADEITLSLNHGTRMRYN